METKELFTIKKYNSNLYYIKCEKEWNDLSRIERGILVEIGTSQSHLEKLKQYEGFRQRMTIPAENIKDGFLTCFNNQEAAYNFLEEYYLPKFIETRLICNEIDFD